MDHPPVPGATRRTQPAQEVCLAMTDTLPMPYPGLTSNSDRLRRPARCHPVSGRPVLTPKMVAGFPAAKQRKHHNVGSDDDAAADRGL